MLHVSGITELTDLCESHATMFNKIMHLPFQRIHHIYRRLFASGAVVDIVDIVDMRLEQPTSRTSKRTMLFSNADFANVDAFCMTTQTHSTRDWMHCSDILKALAYRKPCLKTSGETV